MMRDKSDRTCAKIRSHLSNASNGDDCSMLAISSVTGADKVDKSCVDIVWDLQRCRWVCEAIPDGSIVGGCDSGNKNKHVSHHKSCVRFVRGSAFVYQEKETKPGRRFAVRMILSLPLDYIKGMKNAVLLPALIQNTIQHDIRW